MSAVGGSLGGAGGTSVAFRRVCEWVPRFGGGGGGRDPLAARFGCRWRLLLAKAKLEERG